MLSITGFFLLPSVQTSSFFFLLFVNTYYSSKVLIIAISGTEALFAHFPVSAIQLGFTVIVFPCLLLAYSGHAKYG